MEFGKRSSLHECHQVYSCVEGSEFSSCKFHMKWWKTWNPLHILSRECSVARVKGWLAHTQPWLQSGNLLQSIPYKFYNAHLFSVNTIKSIYHELLDRNWGGGTTCARKILTMSAKVSNHTPDRVWKLKWHAETSDLLNNGWHSWTYVPLWITLLVRNCLPFLPSWSVMAYVEPLEPRPHCHTPTRPVGQSLLPSTLRAGWSSACLRGILSCSLVGLHSDPSPSASWSQPRSCEKFEFIWS